MTRARLALLSLVLLAAPAASAQGPLDDVQSALRNGQSFRATQLLAPLLASPRTRTPEVVILAAEAAAGWQGWGTVRRLLDTVPWLDGRFDRLGRRLLAEAALADGQTAAALPHARAAVEATLMPREPGEHGHRLVLLARIHERLGNWDSAEVAYRGAADRMPLLAEWLHLRAAGVAKDSAVRAADYAAITIEPARARIGPTEALAWSRAGDKVRASREYAASGAAASALRMRWEATTDAAARAVIVGELLALARQTGNAAHAREALEMLQRYAPALSRDDQLFVARRAAALGRHAQATAMFRKLVEAAGLEASDRFRYATSLGEQGQWGAAAAQFRRITNGSLAGRAAYGAARADLRDGRSSAAISALRRIPDRFPSDDEASGSALYLLGDLELDAGRPDAARTLFKRLADKHPTSGFAQRATLLAPLIAHARGESAVAASELAAALEAKRLTGIDADAGRYWLGRVQAETGQRDAARGTWRALLENGPESYYAVRAAARLDTIAWVVTPPPPLMPIPTLAALQRVAELERLGLDFEAGLELDHLVRAPSTITAMIAVGEELIAAGHPARATALGRRALAAGAPRDGMVLRLLYPFPYADALRAAAARDGVDPYLAASLIRQESGFEPRATSRTDARGLMQVMPATGRDLARSLRVADFDPAMLWIPDLNLSFGMRHVAEALSRYPEPERALAAYNAGGSRVQRWSRTLLSGPSAANDPVSDPLKDVELFVERMPYAETRGYVRAILRNVAVYRMIYGEQRTEN
jgi:soluble lytic murein transglycosylase